MVVNINELLKKQDAEIERVRAETIAARDIALEATEIADKKTDELQALINERSALAEVAKRFGAIDKSPPEIASNDDGEKWRRMTRLDAVERIVRESPVPIHITEIQGALTAHGRTEESYALVSASLANLRQRRGTVQPVGKGHWRYVSSGQHVMDQIAAETRARLNAVAHGQLVLPPREGAAS